MVISISRGVNFKLDYLITSLQQLVNTDNKELDFWFLRRTV